MICPKCSKLGFDDRKDVEMEHKGSMSLNDSQCSCCEGTVYKLWQCPECKTVELGYS